MTFEIIMNDERKKLKKTRKLSKGRMLLPAQKQILGRDLRIQILALVRARETDCRIRRKQKFRRNECFLFSFYHTSCLCHPRIAFRAVSDRKSNLRFIRRTDWSTCLRVAWKAFLQDFSGKKVECDERVQIEFVPMVQNSASAW